MRMRPFDLKRFVSYDIMCMLFLKRSPRVRGLTSWDTSVLCRPDFPSLDLRTAPVEREFACCLHPQPIPHPQPSIPNPNPHPHPYPPDIQRIQLQYGRDPSRSHLQLNCFSSVATERLQIAALCLSRRDLGPSKHGRF